MKKQKVMQEIKQAIEAEASEVESLKEENKLINDFLQELLQAKMPREMRALFLDKLKLQRKFLEEKISNTELLLKANTEFLGILRGQYFMIDMAMEKCKKEEK